MIKSLSAKFYFIEVDDEGEERLRFRSVRNLDTNATDENINTLADIYQNLSNDFYPTVEKEEVYVIKKIQNQRRNNEWTRNWLLYSTQTQTAVLHSTSVIRLMICLKRRSSRKRGVSSPPMHSRRCRASRYQYTLPKSSSRLSLKSSDHGVGYTGQRCWISGCDHLLSPVQDGKQTGCSHNIHQRAALNRTVPEIYPGTVFLV